MADFIGFSSFGNTSFDFDTAEAFKFLLDFDEAAFRCHSRKTPIGKLGFVSTEQTDLYADKDRLVFLHGNCYSKIEAKQNGQAKPFQAKMIAELYAREGVQFLHSVKGSFIIVIMDNEERRIKIFNDPLNLRSVFYSSFDSGEVIFSSSLNAIINIIKSTGQRVTLNRGAILDQYLFDFILDDSTHVEEVREMPLGTILQIEKAGISMAPYFDPFTHFDLSGPKMDKKEGFKAIKGILSKNIRLYQKEPESTLVALTGGFDSRSLLALLGDQLNQYRFYSYGRKESWDLRIPERIGERLNLNYEPIHLGNTFAEVFPEFAKRAVLLSDGYGTFTQANIAYVHAEYFKQRNHLLTGLFGSELIKTPSSRGLFIDRNVISLLESSSVESAFKDLVAENRSSLAVISFVTEELLAEQLERIKANPYINNDLPLNEKYFHFLLNLGMRRYFQREIKIEKPWKTNLHPFFDLEFIEVLLNTPFPWVHNFSIEKDLYKSIAIHQLYGKIIHTNPALSNIISTHGYRPRNVLAKWRLPILASEYFVNKKRMKKVSSLNFQYELAVDFIDKQRERLEIDENFSMKQFQAFKEKDPKNYLKMASLLFWLNYHEVQL